MPRDMEQYQDIKADQAILHNFFSKKANMPFEGNLPNSEEIIEKLHVDLALNAISKEMPFDVPNHYWQQPIPMPKPLGIRMPMHFRIWAQVACIAFLIGLNAWMLNTIKPTSSSTNMLLNTVQVDDALWYLENETLNNDLAWLEWEEHVMNDERILIQPNADIIPSLSEDELKNFF
ncbi:MAG: hypothetical protein ACR2IL_09135 [Chitinophagaceae bacterium]